MQWLKCVEAIDHADEQAVWVNVAYVLAMRPHDEQWSLVYLRQPHSGGGAFAPPIPTTLYVRGTTVAIMKQTGG